MRTKNPHCQTKSQAVNPQARQTLALERLQHRNKKPHADRLLALSLHWFTKRDHPILLGQSRAWVSKEWTGLTQSLCKMEKSDEFTLTGIVMHTGISLEHTQLFTPSFRSQEKNTQVFSLEFWSLVCEPGRPFSFPLLPIPQSCLAPLTLSGSRILEAFNNVSNSARCTNVHIINLFSRS